jgi:hypothetical protein
MHDVPLLEPRGYATMVRFAALGVPIVVIARGLRLPVGEVKLALDLAHQRGELKELPPVRWPDGVPVPPRVPMDVDQLLVLDIQAMYGLSRAPASILAALVSTGGTATFEVLLALSSGPKAGPNTLKVNVHKLRQVLKPRGVDLVPLRRTGYVLTEGAIAIVERDLAQYRSGHKAPAEARHAA